MSEKMINYILFGIKALIGMIGVILFIMIVTGESETPEGEKLHSMGAINGGIVLTYIVFGLCIGLWLIFGIWNIVSNIKKSIPLLISVAIFAIIFAVAYSMASDEIMETWKKKPDLFTPGNIKWSDVGIYTMYSMLILTVGTIVFGEISKLFK
jgi:hypothetical protein